MDETPECAVTHGPSAAGWCGCLASGSYAPQHLLQSEKESFFLRLQKVLLLGRYASSRGAVRCHGADTPDTKTFLSHSTVRRCHGIFQSGTTCLVCAFEPPWICYPFKLVVIF